MRTSGVPMLLLLLGACGGGGSVTHSSLRGVAATGSGIDGTVSVVDRDGVVVDQATGDGSFTIDVTGLQPPYLVRATWTGGTIYSFALLPGRVNVTPLTHAIVLAAAGGSSLDALYAAPGATAFAGIAAALAAATQSLQNGLAPLLLQYGVSDDPITGAFAADHTGYDLLLDDVDFSFGGGAVTLASRAHGEVLFCASLNDLGSSVANLTWTGSDGASASDPSVAVDPDGDALVVWAATDTLHWHIESKWLSGGRAPARVSDGTGDASFPRVVFDAAGDAFVVWARYGSGRNTIWANRCDAVTGWGAAVQISTNTVDDASYPDVGVDAGGNAVATWYEGNGVVNHSDVWTARFDAQAQQWNAPAMLSNGTNSAYRPRIAVNAAGDAFVVFLQELHDGSISNDDKDVYLSRSSSGGAFATPAQCNTVAGTAQDVYGQPTVAIAADGSAMTAWVQIGTGHYSIWAAACSAAGQFTAAAEIADNLAGDCYGPAIACIGNGAFAATWLQQENGTSFAAANLFDPGGGWGTSGSISGATGEAHDPAIAGDASGNASVVWYAIGATDVTIRTNRLIAGSGWNGPALVRATAVDTGLFAGTPAVAVGANATGRAATAWGIDPP